MRKSKKLVAYNVKSTGQFFIRATKVNKNNEFVMKPIRYGKAKSRKISGAELGRCIRDVLGNCD